MFDCQLQPPRYDTLKLIPYIIFLSLLMLICVLMGYTLYEALHITS